MEKKPKKLVKSAKAIPPRSRTSDVDEATFSEIFKLISASRERVRLRLIHGASGEFVSRFSECLFALAADQIGKIDCPSLGKLVERRGEAASIDHLQTNTTN
jgi:hypothetical protein